MAGRLRSSKPRLAAARPRLIVPATEADRLKARAKARPNWYQTARWQRLRLQALQRDGWQCVQTGEPLVGKYPDWNSAAVDHIKPHRWDPELFYRLDNLQSVTKQWHDREKQKLEATGRA